MRTGIVHLGRRGALGEVRRVQSWEAMLRAAGVTAVDIDLRLVARASVRHPPDLGAILHGATSFETGAWSASEARAALALSAVDAVICVTTRAYHPSFRTVVPVVVIDLVDRLSVSYNDRGAIARTPLARIGYRALAARQRRLEATTGDVAKRVVAGWSDAYELGATWVPNVVEPANHVTATTPDHDIVFFGTLAYPPNADAVARLASLWPRVQARRPGTSLLLAGARPSDDIRRAATDLGWTLVADFGDLGEILSRARLAVAPLRIAAGIQNKVLEAAAHGLPQIATPAALRGFAPGWPGPVIETDESLVDEIFVLLEDGTRRHAIGMAQAEAAAEYAPDRWADVVARLLST